MSDILVTSPFQPFTLPTQFKAVFNGYIYCGTVDAVDPSVSQVQVYLVNEAGDKVPVAQPLRTNAGGFLVYNGQPAKFVTDSNHSLLVRDSLQVQIWYEPDISKSDPSSIAIIVGAQAREALRRSYAESGHSMVTGSFEMGGTVSTVTDVLLYEVEGKAYSYTGVFPHTVSAGSSPSSEPGMWVDESQSALRLDLRDDSGSSMVGHARGSTVGDELRMSSAGYSSVAPSVELIAHRGFRSSSCENTMLAMTTAIARGAHSLETDVQVTADGEMVLFHDNDVTALTTGTGIVTELTLSYLQTLKFDKLNGSIYYDNTRIPLFSTFLQYARRVGAYVYPEIKGYRTSADIPLIVDMVKSSGMERRCTIQSFDLNVIKTVRGLSKSIGVAFLWQNALSNALIDELYDINADLFAETSVLLAAPAVVSYAASRGVGVAAWTVNDVASSRSLLDIGVFRQMSDGATIIQSI